MAPCNNCTGSEKKKNSPTVLMFQGLLAVSTFELVREALAMFIEHWVSLALVKVFSAVTAMALSVVAKILIGRILRKILSKGDRKMKKLKAFFKWIASNKKSLAGTIVGAAGAGIGVTAAWTIDSLPSIMAGNFNIAPIIYTVVCVICFTLNELGVCGKGFESIKTYLERKAQEKEAKDAKSIEVEAQKRAAAEAAAAEAEAKAIELAAQEAIKADEERKREQERNAKIEAKKREILAKTRK